jgi:uncharacterized membrane protein
MPRWLVYCFLTVVCFGVWGVSFKALEPHGVSPGQSQALSTLGILPIMAVLLALSDWRAGDRLRRGSIWSFVAGVLVALGNLAYYHAQAAGAKATTAVSLSMLYPAVTVIFALILLREKPGAVQVLGIIGSLGAIYMLNVGNPGEAFSRWMIYALAPIVLWGVAGYVQKVATADVSAELAALWFLAAFVPLGVVLYLVERFGWDLPARAWLLLGFQGATYGLGNLSLLAAFRNGGKASIVAPLSGLYPVVTIPLVIVIFREYVGMREWAGIVLALAAAVALSYERVDPKAESVVLASRVPIPEP